ncbi:thioredoxin-like 1-2, chloroplastic [Nicotiana sylvestris]|uniref:Thioredoxin-like 1-2, chloroplastic n=1 Tax=Nicotiana sylvestris TaxID=4096 RepID=A0A1U7VT25_NICSY|nr:PREDICTED: thioredoxin-like 1-2, chloroplastic [Nicotiana sylvestris]
MACSLKTGFSVTGSCDCFFNNTNKGFSVRSSVGALKITALTPKEFLGKSLAVSNQIGSNHWNAKAPKPISINAQASICISKAQRWWEKTLKPNMVEIHSAKELVDSLLNAGDKLVIIDFYSPGCGGCRTLHPKICQLADSNPDAIFLKVNYEELKAMCHTLRIHVLPFFRFYRGAEGKLCSFSCTNATIKKFKDALGKYGTDRCSLGPAKGLDESELLALASIGQLSRNQSLDYSIKDGLENFVLSGVDLSSNFDKNLGLKESNELLMA